MLLQFLLYSVKVQLVPSVEHKWKMMMIHAILGLICQVPEVEQLKLCKFLSEFDS